MINPFSHLCFDWKKIFYKPFLSCAICYCSLLFPLQFHHIFLKFLIIYYCINGSILLPHLYFFRNEQPSVRRALPPVGWHKTVEHDPQMTTVCAWENTIVMLKQPGHFTSMKKERGEATSCFNLCFLSSDWAVGFSYFNCKQYSNLNKLKDGKLPNQNINDKILLLLRCNYHKISAARSKSSYSNKTISLFNPIKS